RVHGRGRGTDDAGSRGPQWHEPDAALCVRQRRAWAGPPGGPAGQPRQGRVGRGRAEPEPDAGPGRGRRVDVMLVRRATLVDMPQIAVLLRLTVKTSLPFLPDLH